MQEKPRLSPLDLSGACEEVSPDLEHQLRSKLERSGIVGRRNLAKCAGRGARTDTARSIAFQLSVIPHVEGVRPELEVAASALAQDELLEQREIPVIPTRAS